MATLSPAPSNNTTTSNSTPTTSATTITTTTPPTSKIPITTTPTPTSSSSTPNLNSPAKSSGGDPPKSQRGLNKPKCSVCGNVARSRCPYLSCKNCCAKAENPCPIHVLPTPPLRITRSRLLLSPNIMISQPKDTGVGVMTRQAKRDNIVISQAEDTSVAVKNDKVMTPKAKDDNIVIAQAKDTSVAAKNDKVMTPKAKNDNIVISQAKDTSVAAKNDKVMTPKAKKDNIVISQAKDVSVAAKSDKVMTPKAKNDNIVISQAKDTSVAAKNDKVMTPKAKKDNIVISQEKDASVAAKSDKVMTPEANDDNIVTSQAKDTSVAAKNDKVTTPQANNGNIVIALPKEASVAAKNDKVVTQAKNDTIMISQAKDTSVAAKNDKVVNPQAKNDTIVISQAKDTPVAVKNIKVVTPQAKNDNIVISQAKATCVAAKNDKVATPQAKVTSLESKRKNESSEKGSDEKRSKVSNVAVSFKTMTVAPRDPPSGQCMSSTSSRIESSTIAQSRLSSFAASTDKSLFDKEMKAFDDDIDSGLCLVNCALRAKNSFLEKTMLDHQEEVKKLSTIIYELEAIEKSDKKSIKELRDQLGQANNMYHKTKQEVKKLSTKISELEATEKYDKKSIEELREQLGQANNLYHKTKQELDQFTDECSKNIMFLEEKVSNFEDDISKWDYTNDVILKQSGIPEKKPHLTSLFEKSTDASPQGTSLRVSSLRQLNQFNGSQTPPRARRQLTKKEAAALNQWRFSKVKEYKERNVEVENEAVDQYMQNIGLLEEAFLVNSPDDDGPASSGALGLDAVVIGFKAQLRSDPRRSDNLKRRIQYIVGHGLSKLQKLDSNDYQVTDLEHGKKTERASALDELIEKVNKARNEEELGTCLNMKAQLFSPLEKEQSCEDPAPKPFEPNYVVPRLWSKGEIDQKTLEAIDVHFSSLDQIEDL